MSELYVYYKVRRADADALRAALKAFPSVRVLVRADETADPQTWMEVHTDEARERAVANAVADLVVGERHMERFKAP